MVLPLQPLPTDWLSAERVADYRALDHAPAVGEGGEGANNAPFIINYASNKAIRRKSRLGADFSMVAHGEGVASESVYLNPLSSSKIDGCRGTKRERGRNVLSLRYIQSERSSFEFESLP